MAAQDAELKLKVSLDLAFFKQQLAGLGSEAAGYRLPINIKFDRLSIQKELNTLGTNIKKRTYRLNVETNIAAEISNAEKLAKALDELGKSRQSAQGAISQQLGLGALLPGPQSGGLGSKDVEKLYRAAARAGIVEYNKEIARRKASAVAALEAVGSDSVKGLLNGLNSEDEKLKAAAESLGETLIKTVKGILGISSPSREFKKIGQNVGEGFQQGMLSSMDKAFDAVESLMRARMKVLDTIARGMFRMAGIDPAVIRAEAAQRRALPGVNFPATIPPRNISIGPSSTGRALPPGAIPSALPGTAFGAQKYLPTGLSDEMQRIMRSAAYAFVDSVKQQVRSVRIGLAASQQPLLGASRIAGLLPAGVGRAPSPYTTGAIGGETRAEMMARREREARMRSALRGLDVMQEGGVTGRTPAPYSQAYRSARPLSAIVPYAPGGAIVPQPSMAGGGAAQPPGGGGGGFGGAGGLGGFGRALGNVPSLPGTGVLRELGQEFAFATKQVILFGQAYKLLAFIQDFPAQIGAAVGQLQSFRNTLGAISPTAEEARASNELILDLMERYNVPLQSARDGFTKLYASMAPAGFSGDEIRDLFTGITQAASTFGLSADKVDRVNYAFAQMASKGQVMSEELKGQLGDVLPGAMAIFAEAAGFEGPKAIQDFSAALEDGQYKGEAMVQLLKNVGMVFQKEFGPGAEGAAKTFQGIINRLQNSLVLLYESFEPAAVSFLNAVVLPLTNGIKQVSDGLNAFFTGTAAKTAGGFGIAQELEKLRPAFAGIAQNVQQLIPVFQQFANVALGLGKVFLEIAGNPFTGYLLRAYVAVLPLTLAIQALNLKALIPLIASFLRAIPAFVAYTAATVQGTTANKALQLAMVVTGRTAGITATQIRSVGLALKAAFASTVFGAVLLGIGVLIEKIISLNASMADTRAKALGAAQAIRSMSQTEAQQATRQYEAGAQSLRGLNEQIEQGRLKGKAWIQVTEQQAKALQDAGIIVSNVRGSLQVQPTRVAGAFQKLEGLAAEGRYRQRQIASEEQKAMEVTALPAIPGGEGEGAGGRTKELDKYNQSQLDFIQQRFTKEKQLLDQQLQANLLSKTSYDIKLAELTLETKKAELQERFRIESEKINKANFSAADKTLALKDEEVKLQNALSIATKERDIAVKGAKLELRKPFVDALRGENLEIDKQTALLDRLKQGYSGLSIEQEASFIIEERIANLRADEQRLIQTDIDNLKQQIKLRLENVKVLQKQAALTEAQTELGVIGAGLRAGFAGSAANVFERALIESEGDVDYARKLADIETAAMQVRSVFEGIQGAIEGVSGAFASLLTEGVASLIAGTATAKEVFASFLQSVAQALSQAASQIIATYIAIGLAKIFAGFSGGGSQGLDTSGFKQYPLLPTPSANGSYFDGPTAFFANGGIVSSPTFFQFADGGKINMGLMGEAGPEAIMPLKRGADGKLGVQVADNRAFLNSASSGNAENDNVDFGEEEEMNAAGRSAIREIERIKENKDSLTSNSERSVMKQMLNRERSLISENRSELNSQQLSSEISLMRERMLETKTQLETQRSAMERNYEIERQENRMELMSQRYESERRFERERIEKLASGNQKLDISYTSQVINNVEYVTREQAEQLAAQSALRGRELALGSLQNSVKARKRVGIA